MSASQIDGATSGEGANGGSFDRCGQIAPLYRYGQDAIKGRPSSQTLRSLRPAVRLAQEVGAGLGKREVLLTTLSKRRGDVPSEYPMSAIRMDYVRDFSMGSSRLGSTVITQNRLFGRASHHLTRPRSSRFGGR